MEIKEYQIVVSGDICINSLLWRTQPQYTKGLNWQHHPFVHKIISSGEALLLSKLVTLATGASILYPQIQAFDMSNNFLLSTVEIDRFPVTAEEKINPSVYRVKEFLGFAGPSGFPKLLRITNDNENADMVILDDENNGFNSNPDFWPLALKLANKSPIVIYKLNNPDSSTKLWNHIEKNHLEKTIVVINADDLRSKGVNISKGLSWEKTALDFVWQMNNNPKIAFLAKCRHLIVPFGLEGAIHYRNDGVTESHLYFLTYELEGGFIKQTQGKMYGLTSCFVAGLVQAIVSGLKNTNEELHTLIDEGIRTGIVSAQKYFIHGFGENPENNEFPNPKLFIEGNHNFISKDHIQDVLIRDSNSNCQSCWYIIKDISSSSLEDIAFDIVKNGEKSALRFIPIARFGDLKTVDRTEIEAYRSIKNLIEEYVSAKNAVRPLSIAVFGNPGSGKSFGVSEIASSIAPNLIEKLNFNLSQFEKLLDLNSSFHRVRDLSLEGKLPLVFFDEFDSDFDGKLGWLKYFLAPMQDGTFREGDSIHPIGKAIFVFAGGTSNTYKGFCGEDIQNEKEYKHFYRQFQGAKGPDFVSRLRGYVNILGLNPTDEREDQLFIVRRAMLLRSLLERKVPHLLNEDGKAQIDNGVLRALLKVTRFKHESRSMEAILEMSMLSTAKKWEQAYLPSMEQLKLHVDEEQFSRHLMRDAFYSEKIENLARDLHFEFNKSLEKKYKQNWNAVKSWESLTEEEKNPIRDQVIQIPSALHKINYDLISVKDKPEVITFTESELYTLAKYIYKRTKKKGETFVRWDRLSNDAKSTLIEQIKFWPKILADSNFKIEHLRLMCPCEIIRD